MKKRNVAIALPVTGEEEWLAVKEPIMSGWLTQGPKVAEFERQFALHHQVKHALAVSSCTTGLHLALLALGIGPGDEVLVPAFTWIATANVVLYCGATPVFVDIDKSTYNIDPALVAEKVSARTKAVIVVHLFGLCADVDAIRAAIPEHVRIVEDAACAAGARYKDKWAGSLGDIAVFSFHPRKIITTGEGGMITTVDDDMAEHIAQMRSHGASISEEQRHLGPRPYILPDFNILGFNYRMTDLQGAVGIIQLSKLDSFITERRKWASWYSEKLGELEWLSLPSKPDYADHNWQAFVTIVNEELSPKKRNSIMVKLQEKGIATRPGTHAVHTLEYYLRLFSHRPENFPNSLHCHMHTMALPLHNRMNKDDYEYCLKTLKEL